MIIIFGIFAKIMRKLVIVGAENQHSQLELNHDSFIFFGGTMPLEILEMY